VPPFGGPEQMLKYLTGYTHRVALSNRRLVKLQDDRVTFTWKDYADGCRRKEMRLDAVEFVRRFALHIIPRGLVRIRQYGLLAHRDRGQRLALCRSLLGVQEGSPAIPEKEPTPTAEAGAQDSAREDVASGSPPVEPKPTSLSRLGMGVLATAISLGACSGGAVPPASSAAVSPAAVVVEDRCPNCGLGRIETIWHAGRPSREERLRVPILDSS
jgi:hypothetical protein